LPTFDEKLIYIAQNLKMTSFDYSQFSGIQKISSGEYAQVYSATFQGKKYALKNFNTSLSIDDCSIELIRREVKSRQ
ncbi:33000_t:CDS:1, partial [Racocetra persica]